MRDDFTKRTIQTLGRRVGYRCSNPDCRRQTYGSSVNPDKAVNIGVAAHITAASEGGPRYDASLTLEQRRDADNGIWLCQTCAKLIDSDPDRYTVEILRQWKQQAEEEAADGIRQRDQPKTATDAAARVNWERSLTRYRQRIIDLYGTTRLFGHHEPVPLDDIYTDVWILDRPTAYARFDIRQLRQDPALLDEAERHHGSTVVRQPEARRLFILGKPGAGKTTFLRRLALEAARDQLDRVPVFVTLKEWGDAGGDLLPFLARQFDICGFPDAGPFIDHLLEDTDHALLLFDGLDEVPQEGDARSRVIASIRDFGNQYPRAQCLITCRTAATDYTFEQFTYLELADFTEKQMKSFVRKWYHDTQDTAKLFLDEIARPEHRGLRELAHIPLLLGMLCLAFQATLRFPVRRVEIYADALDALLRKWDNSRNIRRDEIYRDLSPGRKHQLFARLAARSFEKGDYFLPQGDLEQQIADYLSGLPRADRDAGTEVNGAAILKAIEAQHGIFVERAHRIYSYAHLSFQEYYIARYIVDNAALGTLPRLISYCTDDRWQEVFLLVASLLDDADHFFLHFRRALDGIVADDERLQAFLRWAVGKAACVQAPLHAPTWRAYYCYIVLSFAHTLARILALALARDPDSASAHERACARAKHLTFTLVPSRDPDRQLANLLEMAEVARLSHFQIDFDAFSLLRPDGPAEELDAPAETLRSIMVGNPEIGQDQNLTEEQANRLDEYLKATQLLVDCLDVAYVSDRQAIEDTLFLPPGEWSLDLPTEKE